MQIKSPNRFIKSLFSKSKKMEGLRKKHHRPKDLEEARNDFQECAKGYEHPDAYFCWFEVCCRLQFSGKKQADLDYLLIRLFGWRYLYLLEKDTSIFYLENSEGTFYVKSKSGDNFQLSLLLSDQIKGLLAFIEGDWDNALKYYAFSNSDPYASDLRRNRALVFWRKGLYEEAEEEFQESLQLKAEDSLTLAEYGFMLFERSYFAAKTEEEVTKFKKEALRYMEEANTLTHSEHPFVLIRYACLLVNENLQTAKEFFDKTENFIQKYYWQYFKKGDKKEEREYRIQVYFDLYRAIYHFQLGNFEEAKKLLTPLANLSSDEITGVEFSRSVSNENQKSRHCHTYLVREARIWLDFIKKKEEEIKKGETIQSSSFSQIPGMLNDPNFLPSPLPSPRIKSPEPRKPTPPAVDRSPKQEEPISPIFDLIARPVVRTLKKNRQITQEQEAATVLLIKEELANEINPAELAGAYNLAKREDLIKCLEKKISEDLSEEDDKVENYMIINAIHTWKIQMAIPTLILRRDNLPVPQPRNPEPAPLERDPVLLARPPTRGRGVPTFFAPQTNPVPAVEERRIQPPVQAPDTGQPAPQLHMQVPNKPVPGQKLPPPGSRPF